MPFEPKPPATGPVATQWIISRRDDSVWFIGSALVGYLALALLAAGFPPIPLMLIWLLGVDGPHVLATVTRTYFDRVERAKLGPTLWIPVPLLLLGPLAVAVGQGSVFFLFAVCWQHFHVVKQHFGFVMLYKAKNRERDQHDFFLDRWFLLTSLFVPLGLFVLRTRPGLTQLAPLDWVASAAVAVYAVLTLAWLWRQVEKFRAGSAMNWPKLALLACVVPLQWLALLHASQHGPDGIVRAGITLGLFHSIQYHRLLWFHNRNRYAQPEGRAKYGLAAKTASHVLVYFGIAAGLYLLLVFLPQLVFPGEMAAASVWGFSFAHFILDAKIWRVRSDRDLAVALRLA